MRYFLENFVKLIEYLLRVKFALRQNIDCYSKTERNWKPLPSNVQLPIIVVWSFWYNPFYDHVPFDIDIWKFIKKNWRSAYFFHSIEMRGLCLMKWRKKNIKNEQYAFYTYDTKRKPKVAFSVLHFVVLCIFPYYLTNKCYLVAVDIQQDIH